MFTWSLFDRPEVWAWFAGNDRPFADQHQWLLETKLRLWVHCGRFFL